LIVEYFDHYVDVLFEAFGDRVKRWITFNEPYIFCNNGYGSGFHAPLIHQPGLGEYLCGHNVLIAHARAYHLYKEKYKSDFNGQVGICLYSAFFYPHSDSVNASLADQAVNHMLGWFAHPIFSSSGDYPKIMKDNIKRNSDKEGRPWSRLPEFTTQEIESLKGSSDFLALNYYTSRLVHPKEIYPDVYNWESDAGIIQLVDPSWIKGKSYFLYSVPDGLHDLLVWIKDNYDNPQVLITENGWSDGGEIEDDNRITYLRDHLNAISRAIKNGCNVKAYTMWSLIDNFEWTAGYTECFGIYKIDFASPNKERIAKKSSTYFSEVAKSKKIK
jgi:beta-glucosidase/6-phospho-beta-glucosidase/beta-galactosidase